MVPSDTGTAPAAALRAGDIRHLLLQWAAPVAVLVGTVVLRLWVRASLSLGDIPGPGGVKTIAAIGVGHTGRDWTTWLVAAAMPLAGDDALQAAALVMVGCSVAAVAGAMLAGHAVGGRATGLAAGCVAATWSQIIHPAVVIGADGVAMGASWLGIGLLWWGSQRWRRIPAVVGGAGLLYYALLVKVTAAPVVALAALTPLVGGPPALMAVSVAIVAGVLSQATLSGPGATAVGFTWPRGAAEQLLASHPERFVFGILGQMALVGALLPGRRWLLRLSLFAALTVTLDVAAQSGGVKARPRHLATGGLGLVVLSGWLAGAVPAFIERLVSWKLPKALRGVLRPAAAIPAIFLMNFLMQDTLGFFHGWAALRSSYLAQSACTLPRPKASWGQLYHGISRHGFTDHSDPGADVLVELAQNGPPGGVATVVLRDNREFHLLAGATLGGTKATILDPRKCCKSGPSAACARTVAQALDRAGAMVILPTDTGLQRTPRVNHPHDRFRALLKAQLSPLEDRTRWWQTWQGTGSGGALPCTKGVGR